MGRVHATQPKMYVISTLMYSPVFAFIKERKKEMYVCIGSALAQSTTRFPSAPVGNGSNIEEPLILPYPLSNRSSKSNCTQKNNNEKSACACVWVSLALKARTGLNGFGYDPVQTLIILTDLLPPLSLAQNSYAFMKKRRSSWVVNHNSYSSSTELASV